MRADEIVAYTEALARIAASGGGPKALATHLAVTAGGGVLLEDANWRHLTSAGSGTIPASARSVVESGAPGYAQPVMAGNAGVGWLSLFGGDRAADADVLLRLTAAAIGVELARDGATLRERAGDFWQSLLTQAFHDATAARDEATARGIALASQYLAVALEVEEGAPAELRPLVGDAFRSSEGDVGLMERGATLVAFVPAARAVDASNAKTAASLLPKSIARRKPQLRVCGGVGTVESPIALERSVRAAEAALAIGRRIYGAGRVFAYDDLGAFRLLYEGADVERLRGFARDVLAPLRAYDEQHQTDLERTLKLYFKVGQNVKTAASELNVHRHTVFYRLRQIGEICARSLDTPQDQLTLRMAVAIDELHDAN